MHPIILTIMLVPMLMALAVWVGVGWAYWNIWTTTIQHAVVDYVPVAWVTNWDAAKLISWFAAALVLIILAPVIIATALLVAAVFAMPILVRLVAQSDYPNLVLRHGGTVTGSIWNTLAAIVRFALLWIVTLPLWLLGPLAVPLPILLSADLNQRLFRYDALSDHADPKEMQDIFEIARGRLFLLGIMTGAMYFIPFVNLVAPVLSALAFIHLCLEELEHLREFEPGDGPRPRLGAGAKP